MSANVPDPDTLLALGEAEARALVEPCDPAALLALAYSLKQEALRSERLNASRAFRVARLILDIAAWKEAPLVRALGLQTEATLQVLSQREYEKALALFEQSAAIFRQHGDELGLALGEVSRVWALACLQRYDEAFAAGDLALPILRRYERHVPVAALANNLAAIYGRRGDDTKALALLGAVEEAYRQLGDEGLSRLPGAQINRAIVLRNMGRFEESIAVNHAALQAAHPLGLNLHLARAKQALGVTCFVLGRFSEGEVLLNEARDYYLADGRYRDAILADLFVSEGLLSLRRFAEALAFCQRVEETFAAAGAPFEAAQALLNKAAALAGLARMDEATLAIEAARRIFAAEDNLAWQTNCDLELALLLLRQGDVAACARLADRCAARFGNLDLPVKQAQAQLAAARAALAQGKVRRARRLLAAALAVGSARQVPLLLYQGHLLRGRLDRAVGKEREALAHYGRAIQVLESLQGQIMVEFRADFLSDKLEAYGEAVALCLRSNDAAAALDFAERAKSRALLSLLSHRLTLAIEARDPADQPLVDELMALREERNRLYRLWEAGEVGADDQSAEASQQQAARRAIAETEERKSVLWRRLLVKNAAYAQDAVRWRVYSRLDRDALPEQALLLEYFATGQELVLFLVTRDTITAHVLTAGVEAVTAQQRRLRHNLDTVQQRPDLAPQLLPRARRYLEQLFAGLVEPISARLAGYTQLIVVPHGSLHYLPFHALYDGQGYLAERFQISYLPGSSFLGLSPPQAEAQGALVMGHSHGGALPFAAREATAVARRCGVTPYLDADATCALFRDAAPPARLLHLATHGRFRADQPLFSGLHLEDGILTTLDLFNLRLRASLFTLSGCQTGRSVVGGGDELFGLMRACLSSGAASLLLSLWRVDDETTTTLMGVFYDCLFGGASKAAALQQAQLHLLRQQAGDGRRHPLFWASFFLVGDTGPL